MSAYSHRLSIIVPVFNSAESLSRCVGSLLAQSLTGIEIVLVDDGSTDGSAGIIDAYAEEYPGRVIALHQENCGVSAARNAGLRVATGRYIGFTDSDDYAEPEMFKKLYCAITGGAHAGEFVTGSAPGYENESDADAADIAICRRNSVLKKRVKEIPFAESLSGTASYVVSDAASLGVLLSSITVFLWDKIYDSDIIRAGGLSFNEDFVYSEDFCFLQKYLYYVKRAALIDEPLYCYSAHSDGSLTNVISDKWYHILGNLNEVFVYYKEKGLYSQLEPYLCDIAVKYYDRRANVLHRYGRKIFQRIYIKDFFGFLDRNFTRERWQRQLRGHPDVILPGVKASMLLMTLYIFTPNFIKRVFAARMEG
jgi:glycosyltransferase involved in cell wall biosynthesis